MSPKGLCPMPLAFAVLLAFLPNANSFRDTEVQLSSDGPAVLDSSITFQAKLINSESYSGPFYFRWSEWIFSFESHSQVFFHGSSWFPHLYFSIDVSFGLQRFERIQKYLHSRP